VRRLEVVDSLQPAEIGHVVEAGSIDESLFASVALVDDECEVVDRHFKTGAETAARDAVETAVQTGRRVPANHVQFYLQQLEVRRVV